MMIGTVLVPVGGNAASIRATAAGLGDLAETIGHLGAQLHDLRTVATWDSASGERFGAALAVFPSALDQVRHRYHSAAIALEEFAIHHERAGVETERAALDHRAAHDDILAIEEEITRAYSDPAAADQVDPLLRRQQAAVARANAAQDDFNVAYRAFEMAAQDCRERLAAAARDGIVDTGWYQALAWARSSAQSLTTAFGVAGMVPSPIKPFSTAASGVGASVVLGADLLALFGFGEGSWSEIAQRAAWNAAGRGATVMSRAAGIGAVKTVNGQWTGQRLRTSDRLHAGRMQLADELASQRAALRTPIADRSQYSPYLGGTKAPLIGPQQQLHTRTMRIVQDSIDAKVMGINDRWQMAAAGGRNAVVLQASSSAVTTALNVRATEQKVQDTRERLSGDAPTR